MPLFEKLARVSEFMEGENHILSSSYWGALRIIEDALKPVEGDSPSISLLRRTMSDDHFENRVTLEQSVHNPLNVFGTLLDSRSENCTVPRVSVLCQLSLNMCICVQVARPA